MIATVQGILLSKKPEHVVVVVLGFGLDIEIPLSTFYSLPEKGELVFLYTHMLVREDAIRLFGFLTESELGMFRLLIEINRIGPKLALSILSGISPTDLHRAAIQKDSRLLSSIPGIGKKSAERILFEITDKLDKIGALQGRMLPSPLAGQFNNAAEVIGIMVNLGYKQKDAERVVEEVLAETAETLAVDDLIRSALKKLAGR